MAHAGFDQNVFIENAATLDGLNSSDPEGEAITYSWEIILKPLSSRAQLAGPNTSSPIFLADKEGVYKIKLIVNDGKLDSPPSEVTVTVSTPTNTAPMLNTIASPQLILIGTELRFTLSGSDNDSGDEVVFTSSNLPKNSSLNGETGEFRFNPSLTQVGSHTVTFQAFDGKETASQNVIFTVQPAALGQKTSLASRILDANAFANGNVVPLVGVEVGVEEVSGVNCHYRQSRIFYFSRFTSRSTDYNL